jgi:chromosome segregation ATPase
MAPKETSDDEGTGILSGLLAPLRLPERALAALETLAETAQNLGPMRSELTRVREQTEPLSELMPAMERLVKQTEPLSELMPAMERLLKQTEPLAELLPALQRLEENLGTRLDSLHEVVVALEGDDSHLNAAVGELHREVAAMHKTLYGLQDDVQRITDRLPDPTRGPLEKARDVLAPSGNEEKE